MFEKEGGNSLAVQRLGLPAFTAGGTGLISGLGTEIPHGPPRVQKKNKTKRRRRELGGGAVCGFGDISFHGGILASSE